LIPKYRIPDKLEINLQKHWTLFLKKSCGTLGRSILLVQVDQVFCCATIARPMACTSTPVANMFLLLLPLLFFLLIEDHEVFCCVTIFGHMALASALVAK